MKKILAIAFIILVFILACMHASATDFYFSAAGNDANDGLTTSTPWLSIAKFNSVFASRAPGDQMLFRRGDSFYGALIISRSGSAGLPITIGAYGSGADPIVTGFTTVSAWTNLGSNIWESTSAVSTLYNLNVVSIGGVNTAMGRFPNTGYLTYQSASTNVSITSSSLNSATTNWTGADVVMKTSAFVMKRAEISAHSGGTLTYTNASSTDNGTANYGFFIQDDARTLDVQNEWHFNTSTKKIRIYSTSSPTNVQVASLDSLVYAVNRAYITFDNINFIGSNSHCFNIAGTSNLTIQNCNLDFHHYGVWAGNNSGTAAPNFNFTGNTVNHINSQAIVLRSDYQTPYLGYNTFNNCGVLHGMFRKIGTQFNGAYGTIFTSGVHGMVAEYNVIDSTGNNGIWTSGAPGNNTSIRFNEISKFNMILGDGGGIYMWTGPSNTPGTGITIYNNIVRDGVGENAGTTNTGAAQSSGIYLDENTRNAEVYNNSCFNNPLFGIFLNSTQLCNVHDNTVYNNGTYQIRVGSDFVILSTNNILEDNIFVARATTQKCVVLSSNFDDVKTNPFFSTIDNNYYAKPIDDNITFLIQLNTDAAPPATSFLNYTLAQWKAYFSPKDQASQKSPKAITNVNDLRIEYNATASPVTVSLGAEYIDVRGVAYPGSITLQPYTSAVLIAAQTKYYFDATAGNDAAAGTITAPYRTLNKLNSIFPTRAPGDSFFLKRGETFYGFISVGRSGTAALPMTIAAYGTGAKPVVTGFTTMAVWTNVGGGIWETPTTTALLPYLNMVTVNGVNTGMGRYPDTDAADGGYLKFESFVGTTSITDAQLSTTPYNWTGAEVVIKPAHWLINRGNITSHSGGTLNYSGGDQQPLGNGYGYFIQNDPRTLTKFGEWYHNPATERIRMFFGAELPSNHVIKAATIDSLVYISGRSYIRFYNINFQGANGTTFRTIGSGQTGIEIDSCTIQFAGIDGIDLFSNLTGFRLTNSNVWDCNDDCVNAANSTGAVIKDNSIRNSYMIPGMGGERDGHGWGIRVSTNALVEYNRIVNMGYVGVYLNGNNCIIRNNFIDSFNIHKDDAGAIYSASTGGYVAQTGRQILNNIILHGIGNLYGTPSIETSVYNIYMDDNLNGVLIQGNTSAYSTASGIKLHNCRDIIVRGNTLFNHDLDAMHVLDDNNHLESQGLRIVSNIFALKYPTEWAMTLYDNLDNINGFGTLDSNVYAGLQGNNTSIINGRNNLAIYEYHDLASWKLRYSKDANAAYSAKNILPYKNLVLVGSNKIPNPSANSTMTVPGEQWSNATYTSGVMDGGHLVITPNATIKMDVSLGIGTVTSGTPYVVRFSVRGGPVYDPQSSFGVRIRGAVNTAYQYHKVLTTREEVEMLFIPTFSGAGTLDFQISEAGSTINLDNIIVSAATATITNPTDSIRFEYNATKVAAVVPLTGTYSDVYGTLYNNTITLQPFTSAVLIKTTNIDPEPPVIEIRIRKRLKILP